MPVGTKGKKTEPKAEPKAEPKKKADTKERKVIYPKREVELRLGKNALTIPQAKEILGWRVLTQEELKGKNALEPLLTDRDGNKIICDNNLHNRPFTAKNADKYAQDILMRAWADSRNGEDWTDNGEPILIGRTGQTLSAQHRLIGLILAGQDWENNPDEWKDAWPKEPTLECTIQYGISELHEVVRTIDNVLPRSYADVLYTSDAFKKYDDKERRQLCKMTSTALDFLWERTGCDRNALYQTHSESDKFVQAHPHLLRAVQHVWDENGTSKKIGEYLNPGKAAGILFLMGCSMSDGGKYLKQYPRSEKGLNWSRWDKACEFWTLLAGVSPDLHALRISKNAIAGESETEPGKAEYRTVWAVGNFAEKCATLAKAWDQFITGVKVTGAGIKLDYDIELNDDGSIASWSLKDVPTFGGIDTGLMEEEEDETDIIENVPPKKRRSGKKQPTPEEVEAAKKEIKEKNLRDMQESKNGKKEDVDEFGFPKSYEEPEPAEATA